MGALSALSRNEPRPQRPSSPTPRSTPPRPPQAEVPVGGDRGSHAGRRSSESRPGRRRRGGQSKRRRAAISDSWVKGPERAQGQATEDSPSEPLRIAARTATASRSGPPDVAGRCQKTGERGQEASEARKENRRRTHVLPAAAAGAAAVVVVVVAAAAVVVAASAHPSQHRFWADGWRGAGGALTSCCETRSGQGR